MAQDVPIDTLALDSGALDAAGLASAVKDLPIGAHSVAIAGLLAGLVLWGVGRRFVKPGFALAGMLLGAVLGFFAIAALPLLDPFPVPAPYLGLDAGTLVGLLLAVLLFRVAMAASTALVMALMGVLVAAAYLDLKLEPAPHQKLLATQERPVDPPADPALEATPTEPWYVLNTGEDAGLAERTASRATTKTRRFLHALKNELHSIWARLPEQSQIVVSLSAALGAAVGALSGLGAPKRSAGAVTAMLGAAMWIPCVVWLAHARDLPGREFLSHRPLGWVIIWLVVAALGIVIQWIALRPRSPEPEPA